MGDTDPRPGQETDLQRRRRMSVGSHPFPTVIDEAVREQLRVHARADDDAAAEALLAETEHRYHTDPVFHARVYLGLQVLRQSGDTDPRKLAVALGVLMAEYDPVDLTRVGQPVPDTDRPLGTHDFWPGADLNPAIGDHWYWCRYHERAEHVGWAMVGCIRIGPFMSQKEAERLSGLHGPVAGKVRHDRPLGMKVEE